MAYCYLCGHHIEKGRHLRRKVRTGEYVSKHYHRKRLRTITTRLGWRIVCAWCARQVDNEGTRSERIEWITTAVALAGISAILCYRQYWPHLYQILNP